jgi:hypothetical protein
MACSLRVGRCVSKGPPPPDRSTRLSPRVHPADISTLGGGHFLCKHLGDAVRLARAQMRVAMALADARLAARCVVHLVYCAIQAGRFGTAVRMLRRLRAHAITGLDGDEVLVAMCDAATRYARRTHALWRQGVLGDATAPAAAADGADDAMTAHAAGRDEFYRQRLVPLRL